jgi:catechol-2,3-dioxygenase
MAAVQRLNHAVLYVKDAAVSATFYAKALGFEAVYTFPGASFLKSAGSANDHDLGLFSVGAVPGPERGRRGLYHLAWQVDTINDLAAIRATLVELGSLVGESDHGQSKSLYAVDPDGIEFEVMWASPQSSWGGGGAGVSALQLQTELAKWSGVGTGHEANVAPSVNANAS